jgi:hypothetical protein
MHDLSITDIFWMVKKGVIEEKYGVRKYLSQRKIFCLFFKLADKNTNTFYICFIQCKIH